MSETQVRVTGNKESIHIQRDPMRGRRGYYSKGWTSSSNEEWRFNRPPYNPETDCGSCEGRMIVPDEKVNKHRSHYMRHHMCPTCGGTGRKNNG